MGATLCEPYSSFSWSQSVAERFEDILLRVARYWQLEFSLFFKFSSSVVWEMDFMDMNSNMTKQIQSYCFSPA